MTLLILPYKPKRPPSAEIHMEFLDTGTESTGVINIRIYTSVGAEEYSKQTAHHLKIQCIIHINC
jgi:hypothetical protein